MEVSVFKGVKLAIEAATGLSTDALHVYVGLSIFLLAKLALPKHLNKLLPLAFVVVAAVMGELLDMRDDINNLGYWRWQASLHDLVNTVFWPFILYVFIRSSQKL